MFANAIQPIAIPFVANFTFKNNLFYGFQLYGQLVSDGAWWGDNQPYSVVGLDTIPNDLATEAGVVESERKFECTNNCYYQPPKVADFWGNYAQSHADTFIPTPWMHGV